MKPVLIPDIAALVQALALPCQAGADLRLDSRDVQPGDVFVAVAGATNHGRDFIAQAAAAGAVAVVVDNDDADVAAETLVFAVPNLRAQLGELGHRWYGEPSAALTVIAVTGTNGKTTCVQWLAAALNAGGIPCGVIGTLGLAFGEEISEVGLTTPDVLTLHRTLAQWQKQGARAVALEASSIGIVQGRLAGVQIAVAAYTNLTHDHLDVHGTIEAYAAAKARLFDWPGLKAAVINADDETCAQVLTRIPQVPRRIGFSLDSGSSSAVRAEDVRETVDGVAFTLATSIGQADIATALIGRHNAANLLLVAGVLQALGWPLDYIAAALGGMKPVAGRLETVAAADVVGDETGLPRVVVDYAHTPDALTRALAALRPVAAARGGRLICVFGCGGNRDAAKRPVMGRIAADGADAVIVTSDNPRSDNPQAIMDQICAGMADGAAAAVIPDRAHAILRAVWSAAAEDVVLIAGKGHETYQDIAGQKHFFDDRQWARAALAFLPAPAVSTDTRTIKTGDVFLALAGEYHDGHDYLIAAHAAGARAAIVARHIHNADIAQIVLGESESALARLAGAWRAQMDTQTRLPLIAVTGSNGKTTTKEMIAAILAAWLGEDARFASPGNYNNIIGVPLALLRLRGQHRAGVAELGMNHPGEIAVLAALAAPTVALVNNAQREHLEFMHTVDAVARENGSVLAALPENGTAVYPADDAYTPLWDELSAGRARLRFGVSAGDVYASDIAEAADRIGCTVHTQKEKGALTLPLPGRHNLHNALAAIACTQAVGVPLAVALVALGTFTAVSGRMQRIAFARGVTLIDDTYNANPDSVRAAIDVLAGLPAPRVLVLGDMGEVGADSAALHKEVGAYARERGIDHLLTLGEAGRHVCDGYDNHAGKGAENCAATAHGFDEVDPLVRAWVGLRPASVLVKGSRAMCMERVIAAWFRHGKGADHAA